jgi:hypothetical protein
LGCRFDCKVFGLEILEAGDKLGAHGVAVGNVITAIQSQPVLDLEDSQEVVSTSPHPTVARIGALPLSSSSSAHPPLTHLPLTTTLSPIITYLSLSHHILYPA